jgi:hypothetical protein
MVSVAYNTSNSMHLPKNAVFAESTTTLNRKHLRIVRRGRAHSGQIYHYTFPVIPSGAVIVSAYSRLKEAGYKQLRFYHTLREDRDFFMIDEIPFEAVDDEKRRTVLYLSFRKGGCHYKLSQFGDLYLMHCIDFFCEEEDINDRVHTFWTKPLPGGQASDESAWEAVNRISLHLRGLFLDCCLNVLCYNCRRHLYNS